ncbi:hypothetical protein FGO68_gene9442 [Halteria grandinella]|uniref:Uncharacterized protein n=1 Tax=Halteria grandinella TaxID=5974 RepID=A0A8J8P4D5_HALGN|nr:hypothetical protein FGO68_gene9442 [Halteria grandinella]
MLSDLLHKIEPYLKSSVSKLEYASSRLTEEARTIFKKYLKREKSKNQGQKRIFNNITEHTGDNAANEEVDVLVESMRLKGQKLLQFSCKLLTILMSIVTLYSCFTESFSSFSSHVKVTIPFSVVILAQVISRVTRMHPEYVDVATLALVWLTLWSAIEREIMKSPDKFMGVPECFLAVIPCHEMFNCIAMTKRRQKDLCNAISWGYVILRIYQQYGYIGADLTAGACFLVFCGDQTARTQEFYIESIRQSYLSKHHEVVKSFQETLEMIPSGVFVYNLPQKKTPVINASLNKQQPPSKFGKTPRNQNHFFPLPPLNEARCVYINTQMRDILKEGDVNGVSTLYEGHSAHAKNNQDEQHQEKTPNAIGQFKMSDIKNHLSHFLQITDPKDSTTPQVLKRGKSERKMTVQNDKEHEEGTLLDQDKMIQMDANDQGIKGSSKFKQLKINCTSKQSMPLEVAEGVGKSKIIIQDLRRVSAAIPNKRNSDFALGDSKKITLWDCLNQQCGQGASKASVAKIQSPQGKSGFEVQSIFKRKGKAPMFVQIKTKKLHGGVDNQNEEQVIVFVNDITQLKQLQQMSYKVRSMFFASVAHEFRTPLNSIIPIAKLLHSAMTKDTQQNPPAFIPQSLSPWGLQYVEMILMSAIHLQNLVDDALDMSKIEDGRFDLVNEFFDVRTSIQHVCDVMRFQAQSRRLQMIIDVKSTVPRQVKSDEKRFKQILFNLLGNAVKFTFHGSITVSVDYLPMTSDEDYFLESRSLAIGEFMQFSPNRKKERKSFSGLRPINQTHILKKLVVSVADTGVGIKETAQNRIFDFFREEASTLTLKRKMGFGGGLGFGLTISKMILEQLGGEIHVKSSEGKGSKFTYSIPIEEEIPMSPEESKQEDENPSNRWGSEDIIRVQLQQSQPSQLNTHSSLSSMGGSGLIGTGLLNLCGGLEKKSQQRRLKPSQQKRRSVNISNIRIVASNTSAPTIPILEETSSLNGNDELQPLPNDQNTSVDTQQIPMSEEEITPINNPSTLINFGELRIKSDTSFSQNLSPRMANCRLEVKRKKYAPKYDQSTFSQIFQFSQQGVQNAMLTPINNENKQSFGSGVNYPLANNNNTSHFEIIQRHEVLQQSPANHISGLKLYQMGSYVTQQVRSHQSETLVKRGNPSSGSISPLNLLKQASTQVDKAFQLPNYINYHEELHTDELLQEEDDEEQQLSKSETFVIAKEQAEGRLKSSFKMKNLHIDIDVPADLVELEQVLETNESQQRSILSLVPMHHQELKVESTIVTPLSVPVLSSLHLRQAQHPTNILIVDDSPYNIFVLEEILKSLEPAVKIQTAINGLDGVNLVLKRSNLITNERGEHDQYSETGEGFSALAQSQFYSVFDIIFMDLHMPVMDGFQAVEKLRIFENKGSHKWDDTPSSEPEKIPETMNEVPLGGVNLTKTKVIALSAMTTQSFQQSKNHHLFDYFSKFSYLLIKGVKIYNINIQQTNGAEHRLSSLEKPVDISILRAIFTDQKGFFLQNQYQN